MATKMVAVGLERLSANLQIMFEKPPVVRKNENELSAAPKRVQQAINALLRKAPPPLADGMLMNAELGCRGGHLRTAE